jgi:hypothetical protein
VLTAVLACRRICSGEATIEVEIADMIDRFPGGYILSRRPGIFAGLTETILDEQYLSGST